MFDTRHRQVASAAPRLASAIFPQMFMANTNMVKTASVDEGRKRVLLIAASSTILSGESMRRWAQLRMLLCSW